MYKDSCQKRQQLTSTRKETTNTSDVFHALLTLQILQSTRKKKHSRLTQTEKIITRPSIEHSKNKKNRRTGRANQGMIKNNPCKYHFFRDSHSTISKPKPFLAFPNSSPRPLAPENHQKNPPRQRIFGKNMINKKREQ